MGSPTTSTQAPSLGVVVNLRTLRSEYESVTLGAAWLREIRQLVRAVTASYPPGPYAHGIAWADEYDDVVQDVIVERLLNERQLEYIMDVAVSLDDVRRLLRRQIRITLAHRRRRTVVDQLLARSRRLLREPLFQALPGRRPPAWTLAGKEPLERAPQPAELRLAERRIRSIPTIVGRGGERASTVYRTDDLRELLRVVADTLPTAVRLRDLDNVLREVLTPHLLSILDSGDATHVASPDQPAGEEYDVVVAVNALVREIRGDQRTLIAAKLSGASDSDIAASLHISRPTVAKRRNEAFKSIERQFAHLDERARRSAADMLAVALAGFWPVPETVNQ